jgi:hypothetical protein
MDKAVGTANEREMKEFKWTFFHLLIPFSILLIHDPSISQIELEFHLFAAAAEIRK